MSEKTNISWCDSTWNPVIGCTKVSPGCLNCYAAESTPARAFGVKWGDDQPRRISADATFKAPLRWRKQPWVCECGEAWSTAVLAGSLGKCPACGSEKHHRRRVFLGSLMDWLDPQIPVETLAKILNIIRCCPELDFLTVTKRPENFDTQLRAAANEAEHQDTFKWCRDWAVDKCAPSNVWVITTVENQEWYEKRREHLFRIPAAVHGFSMEPLLGPIVIRDEDLARKPWCIVGGESGPKARPCDVGWIRGIKDQCQAASVPVFVKQVGSDPLISWPMAGNDGASAIIHAHQVGRLAPVYDLPRFTHPKGGDPAEWPEDLRVQEFPSVRSI